MTDPAVQNHLSDAVLTINHKDEVQSEIDRFGHELAASELDHRFLNALERSEIDGDILIVDEHGQPIRTSSPALTIFDVD